MCNAIFKPRRQICGQLYNSAPLFVKEFDDMIFLSVKYSVFTAPLYNVFEIKYMYLNYKFLL